ncbi:MAG: transcription-repair coupling factor [Chloroflexi bacterium]|nr:transcription-repair coupling factor [Chloroflexota bacterium]
MRLHPLLAALRQHPSFQDLVESLHTPSGAGPRVLSAISPARAFALAALHAAVRRPMLLITGRPSEARVYANELRAWAADPDAVLLYPETDALPYDRLPSDPDKLTERLSALERLSGLKEDRDGSPPLVVASVRAAMDLVLEPDVFRGCHRVVCRGDTLPPAELAGEWLRLGYEPSALVDSPGLFSRRGGILDVYPPGGEPLRIELWGDEVDTIRLFDPATQRSTEQLESAAIGPAHEVLPRPLGLALSLDDLRPQFVDAFARDLRLLREGSHAFAALELYRGFLGAATLVDYLGEDGVIALEEPEALRRFAEEFEEQVEQLHTDLLDRGELPPGMARPYRPWREALRTVRAESVEVRFDPDVAGLPFAHAPRYGSRLEPFLTDVVEGKHTTIVVSQQASRLSELLTEQGVGATPHDTLSDPPRRVELMHGLLREGWVSDELGLSLFTDSEIFGWSKQRRSAPTRRLASQRAAAARESFIADLQEGDLVVHVDHGIARYGGLVRTPVGSAPGQEPTLELPGHAEFLLLHYAEGDNLYVPISQADRVGRYIGSGDADPALTRLGSGEWVRAKARVRRSVRDLAQELMELYGARAALEGHAYPEDTPWQLELEGSFPYEETPDQEQAIQDVKADMHSPRPMDRLLVGDVGFGKTEIALRAAFKAVQDGRQVAVLVPTTVLAQQHFNTFRDRLGAFPVKVEMLSRFRSEKEQREIIAGLANGSVDICIGTHRLVQRDVEFKDLGLVVIDEEQRFGVAHKERLKQLRREVDVLTLTATPIPRTLHMGLVGVRDMSVLETAPEARLPVRTYLTEYDDGLVQEAILREIDRGGQVYFVNNRVQGIETIANRLRRLVPEAQIAVAHGQMPEDQLEKTMLAFAEGESDVLVCTTIIESGLDIPNANTLVINSAHRFGLAQLYQLRGRVGRSASRAYAYLLYGKDMALSEVAEERLKTIFEATELGAGMRIAMKDLEIRGAGNLLGAAQSGHIAAVGFDLYTRLLAEQVDLLKARQDGAARLPFERAWPSLDLPINAFIPPEYVTDDPVRLRLYQRFSAVEEDDQLASLVSEVEDRFGALAEPAQQLVYLTSLRLRAAEAGVEALMATPDEVIVKFDRLPALNFDQLSRAAGGGLKRGSNQIRFARGSGNGWMERLYALVAALPRMGTPELPDVMTPALAPA